MSEPSAEGVHSHHALDASLPRPEIGQLTEVTLPFPLEQFSFRRLKDTLRAEHGIELQEKRETTRPAAELHANCEVHIGWYKNRKFALKTLGSNVDVELSSPVLESTDLAALIKGRQGIVRGVPQLHLIGRASDHKLLFVGIEHLDVPGNTLQDMLGEKDFDKSAARRELKRLISHWHEEGMVLWDLAPDNFVYRNDQKRWVLMDAGSLMSAEGFGVTIDNLPPQLQLEYALAYLFEQKTFE